MMKSAHEPQSFEDFSRWAPRSPLYWALRPQKALNRLLDGYVPLAVCVRSTRDERLAGARWPVSWTYNRDQFGDKLHLIFESRKSLTSLDNRWRTIAGALWRMIQKDPAMVFHEVVVDLEDGCGPGHPDWILGFSRLKGGPNPLLPNPYLLQRRRRVPKPLPWEAKTDTMYFRGADSGSPDVERNTRVVLCRTAAGLPDTDCRLSRLDQGSPEFHEQIKREGLVSRRAPLLEMNRHRFLVDTDGNCSSWDRYMWTGTFGGVPILFEPAWEECWHAFLVDGENCIHADRKTLGAVLSRLRSDGELAQRIAAGAARLVATRLSPAGVQALFEAAWRAQMGLTPGASAKLMA